MAARQSAAITVHRGGGRSVLDQLADPVVVTDAEFQITGWNRAAEQVYGWTAQQVRGRPAAEILRTEYFSPPEDALAALLQDGHWSGEVLQRRADGGTVHVLVTISLLRGAKGGTQGAIAINRVLDGPHHHWLEDHLEAALRAGRTTAWSWDPQTDVCEWSDNSVEVFGRPREELGATWTAALAMVHPDDRERVLSDGAAVAERTASFESEFRVLAADGSVRWLIGRGRGMRDESGQLVRVIGTITDVTDRRRVEDALRAIEERLRTVVANAPIVLFAFDASGHITLAEGAGLPARGAEAFVADDRLSVYVERVLGGEEFRADVELDGVVYDTWYQPLIDAEGRVLGGFGVSTDVTERRRAEGELAHRAVHDPLTGLPNRALFLDRLGQALSRGKRRGSVTAVLFLDLDRFKLVNDSHGHQVGDAVLMQAAKRLRSLVRPHDTIARFGGDEFVVLCEDLVGGLEAVGIAERVVEGLHQPLHARGYEVYLSTSIGIALADGGGERPDDLIRDADVAMYRAKESGRARWELFDAEMRDEAVHQLEIRNALHGALDRGDLRLHYQPAIRLSDGAMRGVEALIRWQHAEHGLIAPAQFIPIAEETGLMRPIGEWVLTEACRQVARWNRIVRPALHVSVNLSARQLLDDDLVGDVERVLAAAGADPASVCLEVSEAALTVDGERVLAVLERLKALGVHLAIDDFGAGLSALGYLRRLPVDVLKLDRMLAQGLSDPRGVAVVRSVIDMAHALGLVVVAEGVESSGQLDCLAELGCDLAQGYFLGRPAEAGAMSGLLA